MRRLLSISMLAACVLSAAGPAGAEERPDSVVASPSTPVAHDAIAPRALPAVTLTVPDFRIVTLDSAAAPLVSHVVPSDQAVRSGEAITRLTPHSQRSRTMHDRNGNLVKSGDTVIIEATVTTVFAGETHCNATVQTTAIMPGTEHPITITLNTRQLEVTEVTWEQRQALLNSAAEEAERVGGELVLIDDPASPAVAAIEVPSEPLANPEE